MKKCDNFVRVRDSQSAVDMSVALFSAMNEWQPIPFLKHE